MNTDQIEQLKSELTKWYEYFDHGSRAWSFWYHFCLYAVTILTLVVGFLSQLNFDSVIGIKKDACVAILALLAAILSALIAKGGLDRKWRSNRLSRGKIENLKLDLLSEAPDYKKITNDLKSIIHNHDLVIIGSNIEKEEEK